MNEKTCVGCKLCEEVCGWEGIYIMPGKEKEAFLASLGYDVLRDRRRLTRERSRRAGADPQPTILFSGYSMIPTAPARRSCGIRSRTVASAITLSTAHHSVP